jgi:5-methyltetrahydropteroyltriglutamate--homocysteine methyltransferase
MTNVFRADQIGSFLRPANLLAARADHDAGRIDAAQLKAIEDQAILGVLEMQQQVGIDVYSDGEFRRSWFSSAFADSIEGIVTDPDATFTPAWQGEYGEQADAVAASIGFGEQIVASKLRQVRRFTAHESEFLQQHAPGPFKMTLPGVMTRAATWYRPGITDRFYPTRDDLVYEIAGMLRNEVRALIEEGVSYIQLDSLRYVIQLSDEPTRQRLIASGEDVEALLDETIAVDNFVLQEARGAGATIALHMCRGNNRSAWRSQGGYEAIAEKAFSQLHVDRFLLEYDTDRAGGFEPLRFVPNDKMVVLGLISSKDPRLESQDVLRRRIDEAARYVPLENLALSPQCGFASTAPGNQLTHDEQRRKLELVVETARQVWG